MSIVNGTAELTTIDLPPGVQVGDTVAIFGQARVVGIEDDLVDVTSSGSDPQVSSGGRTVKLWVARLGVEPVPKS